MRQLSPTVLFLALIFMATSGSAVAQERGFTVEASWPLAHAETYQNGYWGVGGLGLTYNHPVLSNFLVRPGVEYIRLTFGSIHGGIPVDIYTARLGVGYSITLMPSLKVVPEAGAGYTHFSELESNGESGMATWVALHPSYRLGAAVEVGVSAGYEMMFLKSPPPEGMVEGPLHHRFRMITFGATLTYEL